MLLAEESSGVLIAVLADATFSGTELVAFYTAITAPLVTAIGWIAKMYIASITADRDRWQKVAEKAKGHLLFAADREAAKTGKKRSPKVPPVVAPHDSPATPKAEGDAKYYNVLEKVAEAAAYLDLPLDTPEELAKGSKPEPKQVALAKEAGMLADVAEDVAKKAGKVAEESENLAKQEPEHGEQ